MFYLHKDFPLHLPTLAAHAPLYFYGGHYPPSSFKIKRKIDSLLWVYVNNVLEDGAAALVVIK